MFLMMILKKEMKDIIYQRNCLKIKIKNGFAEIEFERLLGPFNNIYVYILVAFYTFSPVCG